MAESEEDGEQVSCGPEAQGGAVAGLEGPLVKTSETSGECVLKIAADEVLLDQADQEKAEQPDGSVAERVTAKEQAAVDDEEPGLQQNQDQNRQADYSPNQASEEMRHLAAAAETVDRVGPAFDLRHDPRGQKDDEEWNPFADARGNWRNLRARLRALCGRREESVADAGCAESKGSEERDKDEQAPARTKAVFAHEDLAERRGLRAGY